MENAADALKMAAAVLIFVISLSITMNAFGQARKTSQMILDYRDREYDYTYVDESTSTERIVGIETIIPSIYRTLTEDYRVVFDGLQSPLYRKDLNGDGNKEDINYIEIMTGIYDHSRFEQFVRAIIYGIDTLSADEKKYFQDNGFEFLQNNGIYDIIKSNNLKFSEKLGVYYYSEVSFDESSGKYITSGMNTPTASKIKKRVITYEKK